jgi:hypothetical protein
VLDPSRVRPKRCVIMGAGEDEKSRSSAYDDESPVSVTEEGQLARQDRPGVDAQALSLTTKDKLGKGRNGDLGPSKGEAGFMSEKEAVEPDRDLEAGLDSHSHLDSDLEASPPESPTDERQIGEAGSEVGAPSVRPATTRASSTFSRSAAVVPRNQRRGLLARFAIIPEVERPYDYTNKTKYVSSSSCVCSPDSHCATLGSDREEIQD